MPTRDTSALQPKKEPAQERSRELVRAIEIAATRILRADGWDGLTVQRVCDVAGVSPGSLYQYYPSKEAIGYALLRRHAEAVTEAMTAVLLGGADDPPRELVTAAVRTFVDLHRVEPRVHAELGRLVAKEAGPGLEGDLMRHGATLLAGILERRRAELGDRDPEVVAFLLLRTLEGTVHAAARDAPHLLESDELVVRLEEMLCALLGVS